MLRASLQKDAHAEHEALLIEVVKDELDLEEDVTAQWHFDLRDAPGDPDVSDSDDLDSELED